MRGVLIVLGLLLSTALLAVDQTSSGSNWIKRTGISKHNCLLWIACAGLNNSTTMTGTGVEAIYGGGVSMQDPSSPDYWEAKVVKVEVQVLDSSHVAQIYPLSSAETGTTTMARRFRLDSTLVEGSTTAVDFPIKITVTYHFVKWVLGVVMQTEEGPVYGWTVGETDEAEYSLEFTPKAYNVALTNATQVNTSGGAPSGWQSVTLPTELEWQAVSQDMADKGHAKFPTANYAMLSGKLHAKADLIKTSTDEAARLSKLIAKSTAYFNSSHGSGGGFGDKDASGTGSSGWIPWEDVARTSGLGIISTDGNLINRIVYLYSCLCGISDSLDAFHVGGTNTALFGFTNVVMSSLKAGSVANDEAYNESNGTVIMTDKLTTHVDKLLVKMAEGLPAADALDIANPAFAPRTFSHGASGVNYMDVLYMQRGGDAKATLHKIYVGAGVTSETVVVFGDWGLVKKEMTLMPEGIP